MATTTPNFGWTVPTSSDLVKDGAVAIETLGDSIDASLVDLKGGTTGQVLAKASGTDMDFSWVAQDDSNAIQNAIVDAKGDLIAATANDTPARLAVGADGTVLTADSVEATGLKWVTPTTSASGLVWLHTSTFSASSAININDVFSSTYDNYKIMLYIDSASAGSDIFLRMRVSGSDNSTAGNYLYGSTDTGADLSATVSGNWAGASATGFGITNGVVDAARRTFAAVELFSPNRTVLTTFASIGLSGNATPANYANWRGGRMSVTTSYTGCSIVPSAGNITGKVMVYGYAI
jgi:hypothetical protein